MTRARLTALAGLALGAGSLLAGCGNATGFLNVPKKKKPVAVISGPPGPLAALAEAGVDGSASHDPDGSIVAWHWSVTVKPDGSIFSLQDDPGAPDGSKMRFTPDLIGSYEVELVVTDNDGLDSDPAVYDFDASDTSGLRLELTWDRDYVDVDLHLVDETAGGSFFAEPFDCYFQNKNPDWGTPGDPADDPVLPFDQDEGYGPEVLGVRAPAAGTYHAFAHYYCDDGFGGTAATVKLYAGGTLQAEAQAQLVHTGDLWDVATVVVGTDGSASLVISTAGVSATSRGCN